MYKYRTSSIYDHFDLNLTPVTLTFNLPEQMFQMALFPLEGNNCAKLFRNPCINVQVMARTSSIYDHFDLYLTPVTLTFNLPKKMFQMALFHLRGNNCAKLYLYTEGKKTERFPSYEHVLYVTLRLSQRFPLPHIYKCGQARGPLITCKWVPCFRLQ